ncbi:hypothetical protein [Flavobacterium sp. LC2016-01]|uniref:hypothetical protein n=1 Tax=Flavobacterium sp. LC2016-01 TaxID=2675876 RepID=UPI0012BAC32C|nr:hypothetical protein [Flavobacterium sp. LC2016-01]MTH14544.1 hypothetical protein [Flavobacterium sp. LC2016-01]
MEKPRIINTLNILQKIEMVVNANVLFYFSDIPNWSQNEFLYGVGEPVDYYEVVEINFNLDYSERVDLYWKIHRYIGEKSFLTVENNSVNFWKGEITEYEEEWGCFDDIDHEILILNFSKYNVPKNVQDWKNDYMKLEKRYFSILNEKI